MSAHTTRRRPWSLARIWRTHRAALYVYCALESSSKSAVTTPTRAALAKLTGISRLKTISAALTVLEQAGWIERVHVPVVSAGQRATLLRVILKFTGRALPLRERLLSRKALAEVAEPQEPAPQPQEQSPAPPPELTVPQDPMTGVSLPLALSLARQRKDDTEIARLEAKAAEVRL
jgi:hypothetical protein